MLSLRVSATDIDALRRYRDDEDAELTDLLAQLSRESPPTSAMIAGTAFHAALEVLNVGDFQQVAAEGHTFVFDIDEEIDLPAIREMKLTSDYLIDGVTVTLVGKVDAVTGRCVVDHKLTGRYDPERFLNSYQWRIYLEVFDADEFRWNVFEGREKQEGCYVIHAFHRLTAHRYPGMSADVERELRRFVEFARQHMPERLLEAAA